MSDPFGVGDSKDTSHLVWKDVSPVRVSYHGPIFDVALVDRLSTDGRKGTFVEVLCPEWITVIPWYRASDGRPMFIMEQQFRHGAAAVTREFPAGLVEKGEDPKDAALRELMEETGCTTRTITKLGDINPNSAFMSNRANFFLAEGLEPVSGQHLDKNEQLDVLSVPVEEVMRDIGTGMYDNGIMMIAMGFFLKESRKRPELLPQGGNR
ncbi:MAG: NUDIX hydrolase [Sphaerochaeta sp.]|jgi:8-oxo-dGTP pyrophosphatase MutT (NUDIX family)|nr:NUDIX hydrolase [Sphaerochaeta sp.]MCH3919087.1 NUDIX hydrolase [Sphaerochaeta sp.]MCI2045769.1 NUDIX hydrolase [Sphaerochaeta sp.]MCI2077091.1 NUDIX hydrolase [Sphaerochaeta sp.]